jgi:hypothetical protein
MVRRELARIRSRVVIERRVESFTPASLRMELQKTEEPNLTMARRSETVPFCTPGLISLRGQCIVLRASPPILVTWEDALDLVEQAACQGWFGRAGDPHRVSPAGV